MNRGSAILAAVCLASAAAADPPAFEVASLKPSGPIEPLRARLMEMIANRPFGRLPGEGIRLRFPE